MKAQDVMSRPVFSVEPTDSATSAIRIMLQNHISGLPVIDAEGRLQGMLTEGDFLRRTETATQRQRPRWLAFLVGPGRLADEYTRTHGRKVSEIMTPDPVTVMENTPLEEVVSLMEKRRIKRVPVMKDDKVVGIISRANLLYALASLAREAKPTSLDDRAIRERLFAELQGQSWAPTGSLDIIVRGGVVELWGTIMDERERQATIVAAENIPGVKRVDDHLAWIEPMTGMVVEADGTVTYPIGNR
ncbi:CBS domain-containing protein [Rhodoplanes sp. Z2-YC6860]|uniref:CBS domain-containing protein n=1 Tax=Rhodoplanes sp. Z2-YC6860 TaxID=674703 RepID=UPI00078B799A|nr:CBS domain-containing protein [Rhodoplanes sp. Z2-YC6860]AMN38518.1 signal-transduction protein [Rhodoplanes sp. Z2-YC6860]